MAVAVTATEAEIGVAIAAAVAVGDAVVDAIAADARRVAQVEGAICLPQSTLLRRAANPAGMTIAVDNPAVTIIGVRKLRAARLLPRQMFPKKRSFCLANPWQNIAASLPLRLHLFPVSSAKPTKSRMLPKK
jgi:hypothetical protein